MTFGSRHSCVQGLATPKNFLNFTIWVLNHATDGI